MKAFLWVQHFVLGVAVLCGATVSGCKKDYYGQIMAEGTCEKGVRELTQACRESIKKYAPIDINSFTGHEDLLEATLQGLHTIMVAPMQLSSEKKLMGVATFQELEMYDFIEHFTSDPNADLNQLFTNFVLSSVPKIQYGCGLTEVSDYDVIALNLCKTQTYPGFNVYHPIEGPSFLLHEIRHATAGWHNNHCPPRLAPTNFPRDFVYECDKGMDLVYGWEVGFLWALLKGSENRVSGQDSFWDAKEQDAVLSTLLDRLQYILIAPAPIRRFVGPSATSQANRTLYQSEYHSIEGL